MLDTIVASMGFTISIVTFIGGFRMIRKTDHEAEALMHKVNGYLTISLYVIVALVSINADSRSFVLALWVTGLIIHLLKIPLARRGLAVRYGGYMGGILLMIWLAVIFTHLPS
jgi:hypothetical protein